MSAPTLTCPEWCDGFHPDGPGGLHWRGDPDAAVPVCLSGGESIPYKVHIGQDFPCSIADARALAARIVAVCDLAEAE